MGAQEGLCAVLDLVQQMFQLVSQQNLNVLWACLTRTVPWCARLRPTMRSAAQMPPVSQSRALVVFAPMMTIRQWTLCHQLSPSRYTKQTLSCDINLASFRDCSQ